MSTQLSRRHFIRNVAAGVAGLELTPQFPLNAFAALPPWKAGLARVLITPQKALWVAGYASRTTPSQGVAQQL